MKFWAAILSILLFTLGQDPFSNVPLDNPFASSNSPQINEAKISGSLIASIKNGDYVHPTFSPNGNTLAYSRVIVRSNFESTEVLLYDLKTRKTSVLLNSKRAEEYATYKVYVAAMNWSKPRQLEVEVGDGDVDSTHLILNPATRSLRVARYSSLDDPIAEQLSPLQKKARDRALDLFPEFARDVLDHAVMPPALVIPDKGIVLQKNHVGRDEKIWFLDFESKKIRSLVDLTSDSPSAFSGGVSFKSSILFLLSHNAKVYFFLYRDGMIKRLGEIDSTSFNFIQVKYDSPQGLIFLLRTHASYEKGNNPLFLFNGEQLFRIGEYPQLYDVGIDPNGRRIAYCYWAGDSRHIAIKELSLSNR